MINILMLGRGDLYFFKVPGVLKHINNQNKDTKNNPAKLG